jgi:hypothetical protein
MVQHGLTQTKHLKCCSYCYLFQLHEYTIAFLFYNCLFKVQAKVVLGTYDQSVKCENDYLIKKKKKLKTVTPNKAVTFVHVLLYLGLLYK